MKLNYLSFKRINSTEYLLTNELGYFCFLKKEEFELLIQEKYSCLPSQVLEELKDKFFIYDIFDGLFIEKTFESYRAGKQYILTGTCLHIFVVTNLCNQNCVYCQAQDEKQKQKGIMDKTTAEKAVEIALESPAKILNFEFQGGEPLIGFQIIKHIIEYAEKRKNNKTIVYSVVTNTLLMTDEIIAFFADHHVSISISVDGPEKLHDLNRPLKNGEGSYARVKQNIAKLREKGVAIGAIQTTTINSFKYDSEIIKEYLLQGFDTLFLRPLTPLGFAKTHWKEIGYTAEEYIRFYGAVLERILNYNLSGYYIKEGHAVIFLNKILNRDPGNYMELRSPCGAGIGQIAYYYNGDVYTCDEGRMLGEMGNDIFRMGNVNSNSYQDLMDSRTCKITCQSSVLEGLPGCCDCVYHPYCGVCPVVNLASGGNIFAREINHYRCKIYKGILDLIFNYLHNNEDVVKVFKSWL